LALAPVWHSASDFAKWLAVGCLQADELGIALRLRGAGSDTDPTVHGDMADASSRNRERGDDTILRGITELSL
jgi:hypothetical protein